MIPAARLRARCFRVRGRLLQGFDAFNVHARLSLAGGALWPPAQIQSLQVSK